MFNRRQSQVHGAQFTVSVLSEEEHEASRVTTAEVPTDQSIVPIRSGTRKWSELSVASSLALLVRQIRRLAVIACMSVSLT